MFLRSSILSTSQTKICHATGTTATSTSSSSSCSSLSLSSSLSSMNYYYPFRTNHLRSSKRNISSSIHLGTSCSSSHEQQKQQQQQHQSSCGGTRSTIRRNHSSFISSSSSTSSSLSFLSSSSLASNIESTTTTTNLYNNDTKKEYNQFHYQQMRQKFILQQQQIQQHQQQQLRVMSTSPLQQHQLDDDDDDDVEETQDNNNNNNNNNSNITTDDHKQMDTYDDDYRRNSGSSSSSSSSRNEVETTATAETGNEHHDTTIPLDILHLVMEYAKLDPTPASLQTLIKTGQGELFRYNNNNNKNQQKQGLSGGASSTSVHGTEAGLTGNELIDDDDDEMDMDLDLDIEMNWEYGTNRLVATRILLQMANFLRHEIPIRLAHRILDLHHVPYMKKMPAVQEVKQIYIQSFLQLIQQSHEQEQQTHMNKNIIKEGNDTILTLAEEEKFATLLTDLYKKHANVLVQMAKGAYQLRELTRSTNSTSSTSSTTSSKSDMNDNAGNSSSETHLFETTATSSSSSPIPEVEFEKMKDCHEFLDRFYLSRIGIRVLAGQYLALRNDFLQRQLLLTASTTTTSTTNEDDNDEYDENNNNISSPPFFSKSESSSSSSSKQPTIQTPTGYNGTTSSNTKTKNLSAPHTNDSMGKDSINMNDYIGMICQRTNTFQIVRQAAADATMLCKQTYNGRAPLVNVQGNLHLTFPYIPTYLHYVLLELLKNSLRATMEHHVIKNQTNHNKNNHNNHNTNRIPPVTVIIADGTDQEDVVIKIMDEGGGIPRSQMNHIWSYLYTTADPKIQQSFLQINTQQQTQTQQSPHIINTQQQHNNNNNNLNKDHSVQNAILAGLGYGLPISRDYCKYFGGELDIISMEGFGTDAFIHLKRLGDSIEPV